MAAVVPGPGSISTSGNTTLIGTPGGAVAVTPYERGVFKISRVPAGVTTFSLPLSQTALWQPSDKNLSWWASPEEVVFRTETGEARVNRLTGRTVFLTLEGDTVLAETSGIDNSSDLKRIGFANGIAQNFYGAGERGHSLRLNGDTLVMYNRQNYGYGAGDPRISQMGITMPWALSDAGYGILVDDHNRASFTLGSDSLSYESDTPLPLSYFFIDGGGSLPETMRLFTGLTGRQPVPPLWTLGYITSKYGYHNQQEALGAIDSLKRDGYPVDGIVFDLYWYGRETDMGRLEWNRDQFPDHRAMLDSLNAMGVHTVLINQPYINKIGAIDNYNTLSEAGLLAKDSQGNTHDVTTWVGDAGMLDMANPCTREWLWSRLKPLTAEGVSGWWGDLGEPEVHPETIVHANGQTATQYHNVWGNVWSKTIYEGLLADFPDRRPMLMMRGGTTGLQRYAVFPWTTDVARSWDGFRAQIPLMLNSGLSGLGYMGSDVGGFAVDPADPYQPELYLRWLQMGVFTPVLRTHAQAQPEPYHYPQYAETLRRFIRMRYDWLPYNYSLALENSFTGAPLARPLNYGARGGEERGNVTDEYLWGSEVLVAPVLHKGARTRRVYFPKGSRWVDFDNPAVSYAGGSTATVKAPLERLPLFVKEGSFIPQAAAAMENTAGYDPSRLNVLYFPGREESSYTLYEDDMKTPGTSPAYHASSVEFRAVPQAGGAEITITPSEESAPRLMSIIVQPSKPGAKAKAIPVKLGHDPIVLHVDF